MATRFAIASTNWNTPATWDNGAVPVAGDTVYPNGFTVTIDTDISVDGLNNNISPVYLPAMPIPKMTGNTQPSGTVNAGSDTTNAWKGFDQESTPAVPTTFWAGTGVAAVNSTAWLSYQFTFTKIIKRYYIYRKSENAKPISWIFQGSNNGNIWDDLETVTSNALTTPYLSPILPNTTAYLYYRINVTAVTSGTTANIYQFEMTESTATTYGVTTGGTFTVPNTLSGTRNIIQTGAGIVSNNLATVVSIAALVGNTVNFNVTSGGFILNQQNHTALNTDIKIIDITGTCTINFNGDLWGSQFSGASIRNSLGTIYVNSFAIVNINGNIYSPRGSSQAGLFNAMIHLASSGAVLNINGNLIASDFSNFTYIVYASVASSITNITGTLTSNIGICYYSIVGSVLNIPTGTVTVTNLNSSPAIFMTSTASLLTVNSPIINKGYANAVLASKMRFYSIANPYWIFQNTLNNDIILGYNSTGPYPAEINVRVGITYSSSPTRIGTCAVPLPEYVSQGVPIDQTVGTAVLTAEDFLNAISTSSNVVATRLKNVSTVQTTGDQMSSFNV